MKIVNSTRRKMIVDNARVAESFFARLKGLMFRESMEQEEALVFYHAGAIHGFFMRFPIDLVFLGKDMKVMKICSGFKPWSMAFCFGSYVTLELASGRSAGRVFLGDILEFID